MAILDRDARLVNFEMRRSWAQLSAALSEN